MLFSKDFYSESSNLTYYPYLEYEVAVEDLDTYNPNYLYIGCIIKDDDLFVEPFFRISQEDANHDKYSGIKLGFEL